jgi:hypothetical protein
MNVYHRTSAAAAILRDGFIDTTGSYMAIDVEFSGVWVADRPLDDNEGADGDVVLVVDIGEASIAEYEVIEEGKPYREWCVPADVLNEHGFVMLQTEGDQHDVARTLLAVESIKRVRIDCAKNKHLFGWLMETPFSPVWVPEDVQYDRHGKAAHLQIPLRAQPRPVDSRPEMETRYGQQFLVASCECGNGQVVRVEDALREYAIAQKTGKVRKMKATREVR